MSKREKFYPTIPGYMSFKECQESLVFHSKNIQENGYDTAFLLNRIESMEAIIKLLKEYESKAERLERSEYLNKEWDDWDNDYWDECVDRRTVVEDYNTHGITVNNFLFDGREWDNDWDNEDYDYLEQDWDYYSRMQNQWKSEEQFFATKRTFQLKKKGRGSRNNKLWVRR